jgi:hypothetical protein
MARIRQGPAAEGSHVERDARGVCHLETDHRRRCGQFGSDESGQRHAVSLPAVDLSRERRDPPVGVDGQACTAGGGPPPLPSSARIVLGWWQHHRPEVGAGGGVVPRRGRWDLVGVKVVPRRGYRDLVGGGAMVASLDRAGCCVNRLQNP